MKRPHLLWVTAVISLSCGNDNPPVTPDSPDAASDARDDAGRGDVDAEPSDDGGVSDGAIETADGVVVGEQRAGIWSFKGIPYAAPPLGALRFKPPTEPAPWDAPRDATQFGDPCPQRRTGGTSNFGDEDCLTLNVWAADGARDLPVMVFIHGGGFVAGESSLPLYGGQHLAAKGVVVVTLNYRLGALGFLAHELLAAESPNDSAGNYGLLDQQQALRWVRDNIAAFGGDPDNVTVFGESAGGASICAHLGSPGSDGLFHRAIMQSGGGCDDYPALLTGTLVEDPAGMVGANFVSHTTCDNASDVLQCLRDLPVDEVLHAQHSLQVSALGIVPFGLNIDGTVLPQQPRQRFRNGEEHDVPILIGANADEATIFTATTPVSTVAAYEALVRATFGILADDVLALYPHTSFGGPRDAYNHLFSDVAFICPALQFAAAAAGGAHPSYSYHFTHTVEVGVAATLGAFHGLELAYVFGTSADASPLYLPNASDRVVQDAMMTHWVTFATDGSLPWAPYDASNQAHQLYDDPLEVVDELRDGRCEALRLLGVAL